MDFKGFLSFMHDPLNRDVRRRIFWYLWPDDKINLYIAHRTIFGWGEFFEFLKAKNISTRDIRPLLGAEGAYCIGYMRFVPPMSMRMPEYCTVCKEVIGRTGAAKCKYAPPSSRMSERECHRRLHAKCSLKGTRYCATHEYYLKGKDFACTLCKVLFTMSDLMVCGGLECWKNVCIGCTTRTGGYRLIWGVNPRWLCDACCVQHDEVNKEEPVTQKKLRLELQTSSEEEDTMPTFDLDEEYDSFIPDE